MLLFTSPRSDQAVVHPPLSDQAHATASATTTYNTCTLASMLDVAVPNGATSMQPRARRAYSIVAARAADDGDASVAVGAKSGRKAKRH